MNHSRRPSHDTPAGIPALQDEEDVTPPATPTWLVWPVGEVLEELAGRPVDLAEVRAGFRQVVQAAVRPRLARRRTVRVIRRPALAFGVEVAWSRRRARIRSENTASTYVATTLSAENFPLLRSAEDLADPDRFTVIPVPVETGKAGQVRLVVERATGRRWFAKTAVAEFDAANEVICARLAEAVGLARPRAALVAGRGDLVLVQHVADRPDDGELLAAGVDIAGEPTLFGPDQAALGRLVQDLADPAGLVGELLFAFLVDNDDAGNDRNWLVMSVAGREPLKRIVMVDQGFALLGRGPAELEAASYEELLRERLQVDLAGYLAQWTAPVSVRVMLRHAASSGLVATDELAAAYDGFVAAAGMALRTLDLAGVDPSHAGRAWRLMERRLALLEERRDAYRMVLSGASP